MRAEEVKATSDGIVDLLPDDPQLALTVVLISAACVAVAIGCDDDSAIEAYRRALKQMRDKGRMHHS